MSRGGHNRKTVTAESCIRIDAAILRRAALFEPSKPTGRAWTFNSTHGASHSVIATAEPGEPGEIILTIVTANGERHSHKIQVSFTPCNYGKRRAWLHCPQCSRRVFRLFYYPHTFSGDKHLHYFACRHCYKLTYDLWRERGFFREQTRTRKQQDKAARWALLHGVPIERGGMWWDTPKRPSGMRLSTHDRLMNSWADAMDKCDSLFEIEVAKHSRPGAKP
jgi:hypothetical protein